ncbi:UDP-N-acetylmuramoyl-L-alanyl-D-glutamate--2,6-diaminopimelate ligase [Malikia sp.]|uniref:UDP-N-acetylmuramoyl-L-alanyl-D-glutamate--2, 6-diaminopimelate ligase n=1 Tax=Malikia sp. TaxID=2070706 RepID=UPI0026049573|nr:UDP-N-acetylmuramoyl-L-alanyl-D-glutamate--2,6-diaminopimelate ligase [Malikia sp.]MDD2727828.1 UDP-N-acetylmuramoyl-L-alanyl-D-glutamate--2,6-diaminopimelate ligase [Malikia sp.]
MIATFELASDAVRWLRGQGARALQCDSRRVRPGDAFVAWPGAAQDGRRHVAAALAAGAVACLVEREGCEPFVTDPLDPRMAAFQSLKAATGEIASLFHGEPSRELDVVALTGTNGKTSTGWWTAQWLTALGEPAALAGTLGMGVPGRGFEPTGLTTPDPVSWQAGLRRWADAGLRAAVVEASSIGLQEGRLNATRIRGAVFSNLTQDHLDYHGTMDAYWRAKRALFDWPGLRAAVVNLDDPCGALLAAELQPRADAGALDLWSIAVHAPQARLRVTDWALTETGLCFGLVERQADGSTGAPQAISLPLVGEYNLYNLLSALAVARAQGHELIAAVAAAAALTPVPGRMESAWGAEQAGQPLVLVDYCHTPDALEKALQALRPLAEKRGGRLCCVVGCGGDRDAGKRPLMAAAAERESDRLLLTSDNPRSEDPLRILAQLRAGLVRPAEVEVEPDRAAAIARAVAQAGERDVVLLAGKGHEDYQEIAGVKQPFSDLKQGRLALQAWRASRLEVQA